jgi:hypothetical protein
VPLPVFPHPPAPSAEEAGALIAQTRSKALAYVFSLPDFVCTQVVRRYNNLRGPWKQADSLQLKLTFFEAKESYQLISVNGMPSLGRSYRDAGGALTEGEFGSLLGHIFSPQRRTEFQWDHWTTLRKRVAHVVRFRVPVEFSAAVVEAGRPGSNLRVVVGQHGYVYIDQETRSVLRVIAESDSIPPHFPVRSSSTVMDYDFAAVGGREFLLPLHADIRMAAADYAFRNEVDFKAYSRYTADSKISFDDPK